MKTVYFKYSDILFQQEKKIVLGVYLVWIVDVLKLIPFLSEFGE